MAALETQRLLLEEIEVLEVATAQRFRKNPALAQLAHISPDPALEKRKRPYKETLLQQHELRYFGEQLQKDCVRASANLASGVLKNDLASLQDPQMKFGEFERQLEKLKEKHVSGGTSQSLQSLYNIYLSAPESERRGNRYKRRYVLSAAAAHIQGEIGRNFNDVEMYGRFLDLSLYYEMYKRATLSLVLYMEYLQSITTFPQSKSPDYVRYLESLLAYLEQAFRNLHPLDPLPQDPPQEAVTEGVYCKVCDKTFLKETVYQGHLSGKKHKKNAKNAEESSESSKAATDLGSAGSTGSSSVTASSARDNSPKALETRIKTFVQALSAELQATVQDHERRSGLSDRERMLEVLAAEGEESEFTGAESDSGDEDNDENDDDLYGKALPLGTDGTPIPLWLYKLQGLHRTYRCEICGNAAYKGRQQYTKHFTQPKHVHGLMCLGIAEGDVWSFSGISNIEDAQKLWENMRKSRAEQQYEVDNTVEVEDEDGNVMTHKDYMELKKQGLL